MPDLWSGRLPGGLHPKARRFTSSLGVDWRLARYDIEGSLAHVAMLAATGIVSGDEEQLIAEGLRELESEVVEGALPWDPEAEDVHSAVELELARRIGSVAGKLHTGRSRNDQVALDLHLYVRDAGLEMIHHLESLIDTLLHVGERCQEVVMPGYTHLQPAQPITLAHHLLAYVSMFLRDRSRVRDALARANQSPLGAGALAGTTLNIDPAFTNDRLGFGDTYANSLDAVSDRDYAIELVGAASTTMMHLSRFAEELILWSTEEFGFISLADDWSTGSSMMPQKKNPDVAELVRGRAGGVFGNLLALLTLMKGLPLAYNRDMQEDKNQLFAAIDTLLPCLEAVKHLTQGMAPQVERMARMSDEVLATDKAEALVRDGVPFREAHREVASGFGARAPEPASLEELNRSLQQRDRAMGPGPRSIAQQIAKARKELRFPV